MTVGLQPEQWLYSTNISSAKMTVQIQPTQKMTVQKQTGNINNQEEHHQSHHKTSKFLLIYSNGN
jgi:hypothetical protein